MHIRTSRREWDKVDEGKRDSNSQKYKLDSPVVFPTAKIFPAPFFFPSKHDKICTLCMNHTHTHTQEPRLPTIHKKHISLPFLGLLTLGCFDSPPFLTLGCFDSPPFFSSPTEDAGSGLSHLFGSSNQQAHTQLCASLYQIACTHIICNAQKSKVFSLSNLPPLSFSAAALDLFFLPLGLPLLYLP